MSNKKLLIFGYGYVSRHLCAYMENMPWDIYVTSRKGDLHDTSIGNNSRIIAFDSPQVLEILSNCSAVLSTAPPAHESQDPIFATYGRCMKNTCAPWIGYLSATSVYGHHDGAWVDETAQCTPQTPKAILRLRAEEQWQSLHDQYNKPIHIFRLAGIYGPHQNALIHLKNGKQDTIVKPGHYFSRIHVTDICKGLLASMNQPQKYAIYNMADDEPAPLHVVQHYGAKLLGLPQLTETPYDLAHLTPGMREYFENNKRVCAKKIKQDLNLSWTFPTYKDGLSFESSNIG